MASTQVEVIIRQEPDRIQRHTIHPGEHLIGADPSCNLRVEGDSVSRKHARLTFDGSQFVIEDLGSTNGTFLDGVRLAGPTPIRFGQQLRIGQSLLELAPLTANVPSDRSRRREEAEDSGVRSNPPPHVGGSGAPDENAAPVSGEKNLLARRHYESGRAQTGLVIRRYRFAFEPSAPTGP